MLVTLAHILVLVAAALIIGVSKAGFGGGTGLLVGPLLALCFPARESVGLMLPLLFIGDVASLYPYWRKWDARNVAVLVPGSVVGIVIGSFALGALDDRLLAQFIGGVAIAFSALQVCRPWLFRSSAPLQPRLWHGSLAGFATGFVSTLSHVGGLLTTMYLIPQRLDNTRFVGTTTAVYFAVNLVKLPVYAGLGLLTTEVLWRDLPLYPVVIVGTALGVALNRCVPGAWFGRVILGIVLVTGLALLLKS